MPPAFPNLLTASQSFLVFHDLDTFKRQVCLVGSPSIWVCLTFFLGQTGAMGFRKKQRSSVFVTSHWGQWHPCDIKGNINLQHLAKVLPARFLQYKTAMFLSLEASH